MKASTVLVWILDFTVVCPGQLQKISVGALNIHSYVVVSVLKSDSYEVNSRAFSFPYKSSFLNISSFLPHFALPRVFWISPSSVSFESHDGLLGFLFVGFRGEQISASRGFEISVETPGRCLFYEIRHRRKQCICSSKPVYNFTNVIKKASYK